MVTPVKFVHGDTRRACVNCATAKTKCVTSSTTSAGNNSSCDRCLLLKKTCALRPENNRKRKRKTAQAVLAEKVDEIVALLKVSPNPGNASQEGQPTIIPERPARPNEPASPSPPSFFEAFGVTVEHDEAEELLAHFQEEQATLAPYIDIPATTTVSQLRDEKPLLFLALMTAASHHDAQRQEAFSKAAIALLADQLLIRGLKNLALLQGLMLLLGWFHTQSLVNPQITNLLHLCTALCIDLGLNQAPVPPIDPLRGPTLLDGPRRVVYGPFPPQTRTMEERRAYAYCFYLTNVVATSFILTVSSGLPWSPQLDDAYDLLSKSDVVRDQRLAKLVRMQHINFQISEMRKDILLSGHGPVMPLSIYIAPFESSLTKLWEETSEEARQDTCLRLAYHTARMHLYQLSLPPTTPMSLSHPSSSSSSSPSHLPATISITETRVLCLQAALAGMEVHFSLPPSQLYHMPLPFYAMSGHIMTNLARLRACASPSSSSPTDPLHFDLSGLIERVAQHLEQATGGSVSSERLASVTGRTYSVYGAGTGTTTTGQKGSGSRNDRLAHWAAWLRRCSKALDVNKCGSSSLARPDIPGFLSTIAACRNEYMGRVEGGVVTDPETGGDVMASGGGGGQQSGSGSRQVQNASAADDNLAAGGGGGGGGYLTPSSALDAGAGVPGGAAMGTEGNSDGVFPQQGSEAAAAAFPMEWLLEDISGFGLFGMSEDFLMQDMFAPGNGGGGGGGNMG